MGNKKKKMNYCTTRVFLRGGECNRIVKHVTVIPFPGTLNSLDRNPILSVSCDMFNLPGLVICDVILNNGIFSNETPQCCSPPVTLHWSH